MLMEASNLSTPITRPNFINNESWCNNKDFSGIPCSCVTRFGEKHKFSLQSRKQYKLIAFCKPKSVIDVKPFSQQRGIPIKVKPCQAKNEDSSEGTENITLDEQTLEQQLQIAIQEENYTQAAKIRDNLKLLQEDSKSAVLAANSRFYNSFRNGDLASMQSLWSKSENSCVVHPGVSGISGYDLVMGSWEFVWADYEFPLSIEVKDVQVYVKGDMGYVTCVEMVRTKGKSWGRQFATNVFEKINGRWFICVHHASYVDL